MRGIRLIALGLLALSVVSVGGGWGDGSASHGQQVPPTLGQGGGAEGPQLLAPSLSGGPNEFNVFGYGSMGLVGLVAWRLATLLERLQTHLRGMDEKIATVDRRTRRLALKMNCPDDADEL